MSEKINLRDYSEEPYEVIRFKHESLREEAKKCISCGYCDHNCAEFLLDKDPSKSHREKMYQIKEISKNSKLQQAYIKGLFYSTVNTNAYKVCPVEIDHDFVITNAREEVFTQAIEMKEFFAMRSAIRFIEDPNMENPFGKKRQEKFNWLEIDEQGTRADFLYFVGAADAFFNHERVEKIRFILDKLKIKYTISRDEKYCGYTARILGREKACARLKQLNKELVLKSRLKNIIVTDSHAYEELQRDFAGTDITIWHITELIANKISGMNAKKMHKFRMNASYHDPILLKSKSMQKISRDILKNIGFELKEMRHSEDHGISCGSTGGFNINFKDDSLRMSKIIIDESVEAGADAIITNCPHCYSNLQKAKRKYKLKQKVYDLTSLVADAIRWTSD